MLVFAKLRAKLFHFCVLVVWGKNIFSYQSNHVYHDMKEIVIFF